ncbi:Sulfate permease family protein 3 [Aphelenchoides fujianensis]|nr:Sulfate permease family protein 3 [Aphelenchoides fujianensis]
MGTKKAVSTPATPAASIADAPRPAGTPKATRRRRQPITFDESAEFHVLQSNTTPMWRRVLQDFTQPTPLDYRALLLQVLFGVFRLQFLTEYFSDALVSGFVTAVSLHVAVAQLETLMGVRIRRASGAGYLFVELHELYRQLPHANAVTLAFSGGALLFLLVAKFGVGWALRRLFPKRHLIIPWELILVIGATLLTYLAQLDARFGLRVVGAIPRGIPTPSPPQFALLPELAASSAAIAVVQIAFHVSIAKIMSARQGYAVDERQEMYAIGAVQMFTGFFPVFPATVGLTRPPLLAECGATSLIAVIVAGLFILFVLLAFGPFLFWLPLCVLSVIVLVAIRSMLRGFCELPRFWRASKWDAVAGVLNALSRADAIGDDAAVFRTVEDAVWVARSPLPRLPVVAKSSNPFDSNYEADSRKPFTSL